MQNSCIYPPWSSITAHFYICWRRCQRFNILINNYFKGWDVQRPGLFVCVCICSVSTEANASLNGQRLQFESLIFAIRGAEKGAASDASDTEGGARSRHPAPQHHRQVQRPLEAWWKPLGRMWGIPQPSQSVTVDKTAESGPGLGGLVLMIKWTIYTISAGIFMSFSPPLVLISHWRSCLQTQKAELIKTAIKLRSYEFI